MQAALSALRRGETLCMPPAVLAKVLGSSSSAFKRL